MDMDESSLPIMEVDTILWCDSLSDIATRYFFHISNRREVEFLSVDIDSKIRMMMRHKWAWSEYICSQDTQDDQQETEKIFSHMR